MCVVLTKIVVNLLTAYNVLCTFHKNVCLKMGILSFASFNRYVFILTKPTYFGLASNNVSIRHLVFLGQTYQKTALNKNVSISHEQTAEILDKDFDISKPMFPEVIQNKDNQIGFWKTDKGLQVKDVVLTATGRVLRMFVSIERYDNWWENIMESEKNFFIKRNTINPNFSIKFGGEWTLCLQILQLHGAFKLVTDDRWIDDPRILRTPEKKDCTVEGVDLRNSIINFEGMSGFDNVGYIKYLNLSDSKLFDNRCMSKLHSISHSLEYLDISGTAITAGGFGYLRLFSKLRWLNVSRLKNKEQIENLLPFLKEILPHDCVVVCNDDVPSLSYGTEIPYRSPSDPGKDLILEEDPGIGDIEMFLSTHNCTSLQLYDPTAVHYLWKTPLVNKKRQQFLKSLKPGNRSPFQTLVKYIHKAEQYKPLL